MKKICRTRLAALTAALAASLGAAACDSQGCDQTDTSSSSSSSSSSDVTCGEGTVLQGGQCVATETVQTR